MEGNPKPPEGKSKGEGRKSKAICFRQSKLFNGLSGESGSADPPNAAPAIQHDISFKQHEARDDRLFASRERCQGAARTIARSSDYRKDLSLFLASIARLRPRGSSSDGATNASVFVLWRCKPGTPLRIASPLRFSRQRNGGWRCAPARQNG
jgi:hypothetical protein